jgi:hypothetical protein
LITKLLTAPSSTNSKERPTTSLIEEVNNDEDENADNEEDDEDGDKWFLEQTLPTQVAESCEANSLSEAKFKYGFAQTKSNIFSKLSVSFKNRRISENFQDGCSKI